MFCRECGTQNEDNAKFCRNCGLPIVPVEETISPTYDEKETATAETVTAEDAVEAAQPDITQVQTDVPQPGAATGEPQGAPEQETTRQAGPTVQAGQPYGQPGPQAAYVAHGAKPGVSAGSVLSLIFGIVSVVCCCTFLVGIGFGIAAVCVAVSERKKNGSNGMTTAGLVLGIVGMSLALVYLIWFITSGEFERLMSAIRTGRLQDYLNQFAEVRYHF